jgi:hypothetical protein
VGTALHFPDLTPAVRGHMLAEVDRDLAAGTLYLSGRLSDAGVRDYPRLLAEAAAARDPGWLAARLREGGRLAGSEPYERGGVVRVRRVGANAADVLAAGEFNRFYCRGVCRAALEADPAAQVEVYRLRPAADPRPESEAKVGVRASAAGLLADLRWNVGLDTALGIPSGPASGLSVRLPRGGRAPAPADTRVEWVPERG